MLNEATKPARRGLGVAALMLVLAAVPASAQTSEAWGPAGSAESAPGTSAAINTEHLEGYPIEAPARG